MTGDKMENFVNSEEDCFRGSYFYILFVGGIGSGSAIGSVVFTYMYFEDE